MTQEHVNRIIEVTTENCMDELALDMLHSGETITANAFKLIKDALHVAAATAVRAFNESQEANDGNE